MYRPKLKLVLAGLLLTGAAAYAGSFTSDFSDPGQTGFTLNGVGTLSDGFTSWWPVIEDGVLKLTINDKSITGSCILDDLDAGSPIESFKATFKLQLGPGSGNPADGASFVFGPDLNSGSTFGEDGPGGSSLTIAFDTYDNGGGEAPAVDILLGGTQIAHHSYAKADMVTSALESVVVELTRSGTVSVTYKGVKIFDNVVLPGWAPTAGLFGIGARTGGESEATYVDDLNITTVVAAAEVKPTVTAQPQSTTVAEGASASFSVAFDGTAPISLQWARNGTDIPDATNVTLVLTAVPFTYNNSQITCKVSNNAGTATSQPATLTVTQDKVAPTVVKSAADMTFTTIVIGYSEPVSDTALAASRYTLDKGVTVSAVTRVDAQTVKLTTSKMPTGGIFTLTINGVQDLASTPNTIAANTKVEIRSFVYQAGMVLHQKYNNVDDTTGGTADGAGLLNDPRFPSAPNRADLLTVWEYPADGLGRNATADPSRNYFDSIEGFFIPPTSGDYVFFICGADRYWLYLSTDETPDNKYLIAAIPGGWTNPRDWNLGQPQNDPNNAPTDMTQARSDSFGGTQWPSGNTITLEAGKKYYMLEIHHDPSWCGADDFSATYKLASDADPANGSVSKLSGSVIGYYLNPAGASITFAQQPQNATAPEGRKASFSVVATGASAYGSAVGYQWQTAPQGSSTWTDIAGATASTYTTPNLALADEGRQYRVVVSVPAYSLPSAAAVVHVTPDVAPPVVVSAGAVKNQAGTYDVGIQFDEPLNEATAIAAANYTLSAGTISTINYMASTPGVILTVSGLTPGTKYTATIKNVTDVKGNVLASASVDFTVSTMTWGQVGNDSSTGSLNLGFPKGYGVLATGDNDFDVYSDGIGEWNTYDETTFVYESVTGDFDKKLRVEYQDGSSQWGRAGLIVREDLSVLGMNADAQNGGGAGRYQKVHVNPTGPLVGSGFGNDGWEGNRRLVAGAGCTSAGATASSFGVLYPNAWMRLQRVGQTMFIYRSDDGLAWAYLGRTDWGQAANADGTVSLPMPNTLYIGPEFSPENGNIPTSFKGRFVAKFRDYSNVWGPAPVVAKRDYSIGLNFGADDGDTAYQSARSLVASDLAGVPGAKQKNWNNLSGNTGSKASLVADQAGAAVNTTVGVTWAANGVWSNDGRTETNNVFANPADHVLMTGYLDTGDATTTTVMITNIPSALTANGYDVYVYSQGATAGRAGGYRVLDTAGNVLKDWVGVRGPWNAPDYYPVPANSDTNSYGNGNYVVFSGIKATGIQIQASTANGLGQNLRGVGAFRAPINAVQLVGPSAAPIVSKPALNLQKTAQGYTITYTGVLYSADSLAGPWTQVQAATSPYAVTTSGSRKFFRAGSQ